MSEQIDPIRNKYDVYNVEDTFNKYFNKVVTDKFNGQKVEKNEYYKLVIRIGISIAILYSYFHATPFPLDKPLIVVCTLIYFVLNYVLELFEKHVLKNCFSEFYVSNKQFKGKKVSLKPVLKMKSKVELYSNKYQLDLFVDDLKASEQIDYQNYIDQDGNIHEQKLEKFFNDLIKKLKQLTIVMIKNDQKMEQINKEFQKVLEELQNDNSLDQFKKEYQHLFHALKSSNERVKKYMNQFQNLKEGLVMDSYGVETALRQTENDEQLKKKLITQIESVKKFVKQLKERDQKNQDRITTLKSNIDHINQTIKNWQNLSNGNNELNEKLNEIDALKLDKDLILQRQKVLQNQIANHQQLTQTNQEKINDLEVKCKQKNEQLENYKLQLKNQEKQRNEEIQQIENLKKEKTQILQEKEQIEEKRKQLKEEIEIQTNIKIETSKFIKKLTKDIKFRSNHKVDLQKRIEENLKVKEQLQNQVTQKQADYDQIQNNCEIEKKKIDENDKKISLIDQAIQQQQKKLENEKTIQKSLKKNIFSLEQEYEKILNLKAEEEKKTKELTRECNLMRDIINKIQNNKQDQIEEIYKRTKESEVNKLNINQLNSSIKNLKSQISQQEDQKLKLKKDLESLSSEYNFFQDEIVMKNSIIKDFKLKNMELKKKIKQQQTLFENIKTDKLLYSKQLRETQNELKDLKEKYKTFQQKISNLKEEIEEKEQNLQKESSRANDLQKNCETQKQQKEKLINEQIQQEKTLQNLKKKIEELKIKLRELDIEKKKVTERYEGVIAERDLLSIQILQREQEFKKLIEKIKIQNSILKKMEHQYNEKESEIQLLKSNCKDILHEVNELKHEIKKVPELFVDLHLLEREYYNKKIKANVLIDELQCPTNVHRWRKLESTDKKYYELIVKHQTLQKRLLQKTEELQKKKIIIDKQDEDIKKIKEKLKRQPSLLELELTQKLKKDVIDKEQQLKNLEKQMSNAKNDYFETELELKKMDKELRNVKMKYLGACQKAFNNKDKENIQQQFLNQEQTVKFKGGGFKLNNQVPKTNQLPKITKF